MKNNLRNRINGDFCIYCGSLADSDEHFPPQSWGIHGLILPACKECNSIALNLFPQDFWARVEYVKKKLAKKYSRDLRVKNWLGEELSELSQSMEKDVMICLERKKIVKNRIAWNVGKYLQNIATDKFSVQALAASGIIINFAKKR